MTVDRELSDVQYFGEDPHNNLGSDHDTELDLAPRSAPDTEPGFGPSFLPSPRHVPRGNELKAELSRILADTNELESIGYLSDPQNTYARNRRLHLQGEISRAIAKLQRYKRMLDKEVLRCQRNQDRIQADSEKLNLEETQGCYFEAESEQQRQHHEAVSDCDASSR